jgi:hypothetical protein
MPCIKVKKGRSSQSVPHAAEHSSVWPYISLAALESKTV